MAKCTTRGCQHNATHQADEKLVCGECASRAKADGAYVRVHHGEEIVVKEQAEELNSDDGT